MKKLLLTILILFVLIGTCFAYTSSELRNYVNHVCVIRVYNPPSSYAIVRGKVLDIYHRNNRFFLLVDFGYNGLEDIPVEMILSIRDANTTEMR